MKLICFTIFVLLAVQYSAGAPWGWGIGDWIKDKADKAGKWVDKATNDSKDWVNKAAKDSKDWVNGAAKDTKDWVNGAAKDSKDWVNGAAKDSKDWVNGAAKDTEKWVNGAVRDSKNWLKDAAGSVTDFFNKAGEEITKAFDQVKNGWNDFERDANNFFKQVGNGFQKAVEDIKKRIDETGDSIVKVIFEKIYETLEDGKNKLIDLRAIADQKFEEAMKEVHDKLFTATSQVQGFMDEMKTVIASKQEKEKCMEILEGYLRDSKEKIESCSEAAIEPIRDLYEATKELMETAIGKLEDFLHDIEACLDKGISVETAKCGKNLKKIAKESLSELGGDLLNMKAKLIGSAVGEAINLVCITKTRIEVEKNKAKARNAINDFQ